MHKLRIAPYVPTDALERAAWTGDGAGSFERSRFASILPRGSSERRTIGLAVATCVAFMIGAAATFGLLA